MAETIETLAGRWRELAALNEELGIRAGYQNHDGTLVGAAVWDLWLILDRVRSPWLGCQYDIRHAVAEGARSWVRNLEMLAPYVHTLVVKDFVWTQVDGGWRARDVPAGEGMVDLGEWRRQLESAAVAAPISLHYEYLPVDDPTPLPERRRHLLEVLKRDFRRLRSVLAGDG